MAESEVTGAHPITFSRRQALKSRREALKSLTAGLGAIAVWPYLSDEAAEAFAQIQETKAPPKLVFLTPAQYASLERFAETIIPADEHSPGATDARVADYIDLLLSESDDETQRKWGVGFAALEQESQRRFRTGFDKVSAPEATELMIDISRNEAAPSTPLEQFFVMTKEATIRGYYTSEIGIHKELTYKGNKFLREFVGCTHPEHGFTE
jgi:hypothetical protein